MPFKHYEVACDKIIDDKYPETHQFLCPFLVNGKYRWKQVNFKQYKQIVHALQLGAMSGEVALVIQDIFE